MKEPDWGNWVEDAGNVANWSLYYITLFLYPVIMTILLSFILYAIVYLVVGAIKKRKANAIWRELDESIKLRQRRDDGVRLSGRERRVSRRLIGGWEHKGGSGGNQPLP